MLSAIPVRLQAEARVAGRQESAYSHPVDRTAEVYPDPAAVTNPGLTGSYAWQDTHTRRTDSRRCHPDGGTTGDAGIAYRCCRSAKARFCGGDQASIRV